MTTNDQLIDTIDRFLRLFEARDLDAAAELLTERPTLVFPPGRTYHSLTELAQGLTRNYAWVKKNRDHYSVGQDQETGRPVVVSRGRLFGEDLEGKEFQDIPYVDVFVFEGDLIAEQHVWNHLAAAGITKPR